MELVIEAIGRIRAPRDSPQSPSLTTESRTATPCATRRCAFELGFHDGPQLSPFYYRNDYVGVEQWSRNIVRGQYVQLVQLHEQHRRFAKTWDNNLRLQGFSEAFDPQKHIRG